MTTRRQRTRVDLYVTQHEPAKIRYAYVFQGNKASTIMVKVPPGVNIVEAHVATAYIEPLQGDKRSAQYKPVKGTWKMHADYMLASQIRETAGLPPGFAGWCSIKLLDPDTRKNLIIHESPHFPGDAVVRKDSARSLVTHYELTSEQDAYSWILAQLKSGGSFYEYQGKPLMLPVGIESQYGLPRGSPATLKALKDGWACLQREMAQVREAVVQERLDAESAKQDLFNKEASAKERIATLEKQIMDAEERLKKLEASGEDAKRLIREFHELGGPRFFEALRGDDFTADDSMNIAHIEERTASPSRVNIELQSIKSAISTGGILITDALLRRALIANLAAYATGQILLIAGPPGVGKSTLGIQLPRIMGAKVRSVTVRPGWLDANDFLGYYDPRLDTFLASDAVEFLVTAGGQLGETHTLLLDEMNLARIENYGADLLAGLERSRNAGKEDPEGAASLRTFPESLLKQLERELAFAAANPRESDRVTARFKGLKRYGPDLPIPRNLYVVGTLNNDATTHGLSPKVLDRSLALRVPASPPSVQSDQNDPTTSSVQVTWESVLEKYAEQPAKKAEETWNECLQVFGDTTIREVVLGWRTRKVITLAGPLAELLGCEKKEVLDELMVLKVLARVRFYRDSDEKFTTELRQVMDHARQSGYPILAQEIEMMLGAPGDVVQYVQ